MSGIDASPNLNLVDVARAARAFITKLDQVHADPRYLGVWTLYAVHGGHYTGPFYVDEYAALKHALEGREAP